MHLKEKYLANPEVVLREEFDDWAILFDPDSGEGYGLNPVSVVIWKCLDGNHSLPDIADVIRESCDEIPAKVDNHINDFILDLVENGLAYDSNHKFGEKTD